MDIRRAPLFGFIGMLLGLVAGCATDGGTNAGASPSIPAADSTAQLRAGDSLTIVLQGVPDPTTNAVQIDDQGNISLPYLGPIAAAGANTGELAQRIRETYLAKKIYHTVDVSVSVTERYVYVGGEVAHRPDHLDARSHRGEGDPVRRRVHAL